MHRVIPSALITSALAFCTLSTLPAAADPLPLQADRYAQARQTPAYIAPQLQPVQAYPDQSYEAPQQARYEQPQPGPDLGGGFLEFLFGNNRPIGPLRPQAEVASPDPAYAQPQQRVASIDPRTVPVDPQFNRQTVAYNGPEKPGTIIIDTPHRFLYLVQPNGTAIRYGIGVGKQGFTWAGVKTVSAKKEWPDWTPPPEMLQRRPDLPSWMAGGPENPLGARAMYLGSSLYRIHGSNEPWTIGQAVSSGCIRLRNEDVVDLYDRVKVGTRVIVM